MSHVQVVTREMEACIQCCLDCYRTCRETFEHCIGAGGRLALPDDLQLLKDCSIACQIASDYLVRGSERHRRICSVCAGICRDCAQACRALRDPALDRCAEVCENCADCCEKLARS